MTLAKACRAIGLGALIAWAYFIFRCVQCLYFHDLEGSFEWEIPSFFILAVVFITLPYGIALSQIGKP